MVIPAQLRLNPFRPPVLGISLFWSLPTLVTINEDLFLYTARVLVQLIGKAGALLYLLFQYVGSTEL